MDSQEVSAKCLHMDMMESRTQCRFQACVTAQLTLGRGLEGYHLWKRLYGG